MRSKLQRHLSPGSACMQVEYIKGWGKLKSPNEVEVDLTEGGSTVLSAKNIIIATGSEVAPLPGVPIDEERQGSQRVFSGNDV